MPGTRCQGSQPVGDSASRRRLLLGGCGCSIVGLQAIHPARASPTQPPLKNTALDRLFAQAMATGMDDYEARLLETKTRLFALARNHLESLDAPTNVLEVGIGAGAFTGLTRLPACTFGVSLTRASRSFARSLGPNLRFLRGVPNMKIRGLEPNEYMTPYLEEEAAAQGLHVEIIPGYSERIPLETASQDLVVCTLVLCSVKDVAESLREMARVLKPDGRLLVIEHVRAAEPGLLRLGQAVFNPLQQLLADGCHLDRDFTDASEAADLFDLEGLLGFRVPGLSILSPHKVGLLRRQEQVFP